ncbi:MAG: rhomboid family intramembrane serine protease, partial [Bacteroidales bacterium]
METELNIEKKKFFHSLTISLLMVAFVVLAFVVNYIFTLNWNDYGVQPRTFLGLLGIITMPFLHENWAHLFSNCLPLLFLLFGLYYYFGKKASLILLMQLLLTGTLTWIIGRNDTHIGASGLVYALAFFMITVSIIKKEVHMMGYTLIIIFLYGSIIWGFFPALFPNQNISWEGHLSGAISGVILAVFYRHEGPQ